MPDLAILVNNAGGNCPRMMVEVDEMKALPTPEDIKGDRVPCLARGAVREGRQSSGRRRMDRAVRKSSTARLARPPRTVRREHQPPRLATLEEEIMRPLTLAARNAFAVPTDSAPASEKIELFRPLLGGIVDDGLRAIADPQPLPVDRLTTSREERA